MPTHPVIRNAEPSDHSAIISVMTDWWGGRDLRVMLPRLFLVHFSNTSFAATLGNDLVGFLIGFLSPALPAEAYVHFMGVHPDHRGKGLGRALYRRFFDLCLENGRTVVRACTSPVNKGSVRFHRKMGFRLEPGDGEVDGLPATMDYNRPGDPKVLFVKQLGKETVS